MADKPTRTVLSHIKSSQTVEKNLIDEGFPSQSSEMAKRPTTDQIYEGEIAVNYAKDHETLSIKNTDGNGNSEIVGFLNEKVIYEDEKITAQAVGQLKEDTAQAVGQLKEDTAQAVGQLKEDTESRLEMVSAQAFGKLQTEIDSNFNESQSYTNTKIESLSSDTNTKIESLSSDTNTKIESLSSDTNTKIESAELVTAAGISSILGMSYGYIHDNGTKKNQLLNLASINQRLTTLETTISNLSNRLTTLENKVTE